MQKKKTKRTAPKPKKTYLKSSMGSNCSYGKKPTFLPWFVLKNRGDSLAMVAKANLRSDSGGSDCKALSLSLYFISPVKWA